MIENPFLGMNPYREDPQIWPGVHHRFVTYLADTIALVCPKGYLADIDERIYVGKRELIHSATHLMEIDLLHYGKHTVCPC